MAAEFSVRFWGVRGSIACGGADYARYGGNTSCLEVRCGGRILILDGGTGLRPLGDALMAEGTPDATIYLTHTHFDHICGLPFFAPFYAAGRRFNIWSGHLEWPLTTADAVSSLMAAPVFPVEPGIFRAEVNFCDFHAGEVLQPSAGVTLKTAPLNHPNGATGYRIEYDGRSICYITDIEHTVGVIDEALVAFVRGTDILIYDSSYTDAEYPSKIGYGHSTWRAGLEVAQAAKAGLFVPFHHDPAHTDDMMDVIDADARAAAQAIGIPSVAAREGMILVPGQVAARSIDSVAV